MTLRTALACLLLMPAAACDQADDTDYRDAASIHEADGDVDHVNAEDLSSDPDMAYVNWEDVESIDMSDGSAFETSCGKYAEGESWVTPECFACFCEDGQTASCYLAACAAPEADNDPRCEGRRANERWTDGCNEFWCAEGQVASTRRSCTPQM